MTDKEKLINSLSFIYGSWYICPHCRIVDNDRKRDMEGYKCTTCNKGGDGGHLHLEVSIFYLIELIKEAYTTKRKKTDILTTVSTNPHYTSVLIYFCTLREILLNGLIRELCLSQKIPKLIYERLKSDNKYHLLKQDKLFPSLTGTKWKNSLNELEKDTGIEYIKLNTKVLELVEHRNKFLHTGYHAFDKSRSVANETVANDCVENLSTLIQLYVELHNKYVHPKYINELSNK